MDHVVLGGFGGLWSSVAWLWDARDRARVIVLGLLLLVVLSNWYFMRRVEAYRQAPRRAKRGRSGRPEAEAGPGVIETVGAGDDLPFVSIMVPARNEELNIERCVRSLVKQDYPHFEVLVLDDDSTDQTASILSQLASTHDRLRVLKGQPLPVGWLGKHYACHQLALASQGDLLLFTDADTEHHPQMLRDAVAAQRAEGSDMLTGLPHEETVTWGEKLIVPVVNWAMFTLLPLGLAHRAKNPLVSIAIGQFMLFPRSSYEAMGGFEAVRSDPVDDMAFARLTKSMGLRWRFVDLSARVRCRMYRGLHGAIDGFAKSIFPALKSKVWVVGLLVALLGWIYIGPLGTGASRLLGLSSGGEGLLLAGVSYTLGLISWLLITRRSGHHWYRAFLFPATMAAVMGMCVLSGIQFYRGEARWKDRVLPGVGADPEADVLAEQGSIAG